MTKKILANASLLAVLSLSQACSSSNVRKPVQVENLNTDLEVIQPLQTSSRQVVGVRDGVVIVQEKKSLPEQIRKLENEVYALESEIYGNRHLGNPGLYGVLKKCMAHLVDKRVGGHGKLVGLESEDRPSERNEVIRYGIDEKGLVVSLNEETASDRMARFMEYKEILKDRLKDVETRIDVCEQDYRNAVHESQLSEGDAVASPVLGDLYTSDSRQGTRDFRGLTVKSK